MTPTDALGLRSRARSLRASASSLDCSGLRAAQAAAGADTWTGPAASILRDDLARAMAALDAAAAGLRLVADRLDRDALVALS